MLDIGRKTSGPGISFTRPHGGRRMFLPDPTWWCLHEVSPSVAFLRTTKWGCTYRRLFDAQVSKSRKDVFFFNVKTKVLWDR